MTSMNVDFVQLEGSDESLVRDVTLEDASVRELDVSGETQYVELFPLDAAGRELDYDALAQQVRLENAGDVAARVRVVLLVLRAPEAGVPQEATLVHDVATVEAEASGDTVVELDGRTQRILRTEGVTSFVTLRPVLAP